MSETKEIVIAEGCRAPVFQGDVMFMRVDDIPGEAQLAKTNIVAHSETGHHHTAECAEVFTVTDARTMFMRALGKEPIRVEHHRPFDTHKTLVLPPGSYLVRRQREHTPEGWRMVTD